MKNLNHGFSIINEELQITHLKLLTNIKLFFQNAPKEKLLVYHVSEGWEPLCKFLGKEIPDKPFPHKNIAGSIVHKLMATHPAMLRMQKELLAVLFIFSFLCLLFFYTLFR